jgi:hypothetical protein
MDATENLCVRFDTVADNPAVAMRADRRQRVDGALEAVKSVTLPSNHDIKRLVIFVLTNFTYRHNRNVSHEVSSVRVSFNLARRLSVFGDPESAIPVTAIRKFFWF